MVTFTGFLAIYLAGGLTFIPLVLCLVLAHAYYSLPIHATQDQPKDEAEKPQRDIGELNRTLSETDLASLPPGTRSSSQERDVAAGYFAVCREFVPGGVNGKPPERTTPAGEVVAVESPSVYQTMYRSIFDRNKVQGPSIEHVNGNRQATKKARNVFYIVLRLGHLMLYDDAEQLDVRHVISLALYDIDIYGGGEIIPEGELFVKRNCIRLKRRQDREVSAEDSKPFCLFSDNCSEKEDFYRALLQNQDHVSGAMRRSPEPLQFETDHIIKLVQQLHASGENLQTRWINALIGRLFLSLYKTHELQELIHTKITKKITRVQKPSFIEAISVNNIDMGDSAPIFTNPKLRELTIDGDLMIETDVKYNGGFRLEIAAVAIVDLGQRFKPRKINILLAGICKRLEGHLLIRLKPPPSNRIWISFETMPKLDLSIEPIVSSRQITYSLILRAIESKIREVIADTLVVPNWDDIPFSDTLKQHTRGGIWLEPRSSRTGSRDGNVEPLKPSPDEADATQMALDAATAASAKSASTPTLVGRRRTSGSSKTDNPSSLPSSSSTIGISSSFEGILAASKPKGLRSNSFANAASPAVSSDVQARRESHLPNQDAASMIKDIYSRSQNSSPAESPVGSPSASDLRSSRRPGTFASADSSPDAAEDLYDPSIASETVTHPSIESNREVLEQELADRLSGTSFTNTPVEATKKQSLAANAVSATAAARKWGFDLVAKHQAAKAANAAHDSSSNSTPLESTNNLPINAKAATAPPGGISSGLGTPSNPIGRGHPHGTPIPLVVNSGAKAGWTAALGSLTKRKPMTIPSIIDKSGKSIIPSATPESRSTDSLSSSPPPPPLPQRPTRGSASSSSTRKSVGSANLNEAPKREEDDILIIKAPEDEENDVEFPNYGNAQGNGEDEIKAEGKVMATTSVKKDSNSIPKVEAASGSGTPSEEEIDLDPESDYGSLKALEGVR